MELNFIQNLKQSLLHNANRSAFCINDNFYTYSDLNERVQCISAALATKNIINNRIGIICENNIDTYASIIACWFQGCAFVPILKKNPIERNISILEEAKITYIINPSSKLDVLYKNIFNILDLTGLKYDNKFKLNLIKRKEDSEVYILFTSGSTGKPKGVPIALSNLNTFLNSFNQTDFKIEKDDKCLQMFELTFDVSISSFLPALITGACVYTVSDNSYKYIEVFHLINKYKLTKIQIVPSVLKLGKSLYKRVNFSSLKSCILTGEATSMDVLDNFMVIANHVSFYNFYGPTECTIYCSFYKIQISNYKSYNGLVSIGQPFNNTNFKLLKDDGTLANQDEKGELWINSPQLTKGYLDLKMNSHCFSEIDGKVYYKSGDLCLRDKYGDYLFCGRIDNQVQIQGFRVELGEIEFKVREKLGFNCVALDYINKNNFIEIALVIESEHNFTKLEIEKYFTEILPDYMIPSLIRNMSTFPLTISGKTDRNKIRKILNDINEFRL
jgi:amino acid adenylation domain-containing protein